MGDFKYARQFGIDSIEKIKKRIDAINDLKIKDKEIDTEIKNFESFVKTAKCIIESKEASRQLKQDAEKKLDLWLCFIEELKQMKANVEGLLKGCQQHYVNLIDQETESFVKTYETDLKYFPSDEIALIDERIRIIQRAINSKQQVYDNENKYTHQNKVRYSPDEIIYYAQMKFLTYLKERKDAIQQEHFKRENKSSQKKNTKKAPQSM